MAGDWIKLEHSTPDKPEVFRIAETLSIAPEHVLGCLIRVWMWADQQIAKGNAVAVTETSLDRIARVDGFGSAMASAGWLVTTSTGVEFPNFERHNGQTARNRALTAKRVAKCKAKKEKRSGNDAIVSVSSLLCYSSLLSSGRIPESLRSERFGFSWDAWVKHRAEIKHPLKETMVDAQLKMLAVKGLEAACLMIDHTISMGWQGLRDPDHAGNGKSPAKVKPKTAAEWEAEAERLGKLWEQQAEEREKLR